MKSLAKPVVPTPRAAKPKTITSTTLWQSAHHRIDVKHSAWMLSKVIGTNELVTPKVLESRNTVASECSASFAGFHPCLSRLLLLLGGRENGEIIVGFALSPNIGDLLVKPELYRERADCPNQIDLG